MTSPIHGVSRALGLGSVVDMTTSFLGRALTPPGSGAPAATAPPPAPPASQPTGKPANRGIQSSFLSGVAGGAGATGLGGGSQTGKTLLGQ